MPHPVVRAFVYVWNSYATRSATRHSVYTNCTATSVCDFQHSICGRCLQHSQQTRRMHVRRCVNIYARRETPLCIIFTRTINSSLTAHTAKHRVIRDGRGTRAADKQFVMGSGLELGNSEVNTEAPKLFSLSSSSSSSLSLLLKYLLLRHALDAIPDALADCIISTYTHTYLCTLLVYTRRIAPPLLSHSNNQRA